MYQNIVVGTDLSESAQRAVQQAGELAKVCGAKLHLACAYKPSLSVNLAATSLEAMAYGGADLVLDAENKLGQEIEAALERISMDLASDGVAVTTHAVAGDPADALVDLAEAVGADLLVVGNRGMGGVKRFVLGSVPNRISHHAPCSVLIAQTS